MYISPLKTHFNRLYFFLPPDSAFLFQDLVELRKEEELESTLEDSNSDVAGQTLACMDNGLWHIFLCLVMYIFF